MRCHFCREEAGCREIIGVLVCADCDRNLKEFYCRRLIAEGVLRAKGTERAAAGKEPIGVPRFPAVQCRLCGKMTGLPTRLVRIEVCPGCYGKLKYHYYKRLLDEGYEFIEQPSKHPFPEEARKYLEQFEQYRIFRSIAAYEKVSPTDRLTELIRRGTEEDLKKLGLDSARFYIYPQPEEE